VPRPTSTRFALALSITAALAQAGCVVDLQEEFAICDPSSAVGRIHASGSNIDLIPSAGHEWNELLRQPYAQPGELGISFPKLKSLFGAPTKTSSMNGFPSFEFDGMGGQLRLGLEEAHSGDAVFRVWRLRLVTSKAKPLDVLSEEAKACVKKIPLMRAHLTILDRSEKTPRIQIESLPSGESLIQWMNLPMPESAKQALE
jgi:hypothetical protein